MRDSSSRSTVTNHEPSSARSSALTLSACSPVISASWSFARFASSTPDVPPPDALRLRRGLSSAILCALLRRLFDHLALTPLGLLGRELSLFARLLQRVELLHDRPRARLRPPRLLVHLLGDPRGEAHGGDRQQDELLDQPHRGSSPSRKL